MFLTAGKASTWAVFALGILGNGIGLVVATPNPIASRANGCTAVNAGPFTLLYAPVTNSTDLHSLGLVELPVITISGEEEFSLVSCRLGECSSTFTMKDSTLESNVGRGMALSYTAIANSRLNFHTETIESPPSSGLPDYCVVPNPSTSDGLPSYLAGPGGDAENFSLCTDPIFNETQPIQDVWYKVNTTRLTTEFLCTNIHLLILPTSSESAP